MLRDLLFIHLFIHPSFCKLTFVLNSFALECFHFAVALPWAICEPLLTCCIHNFAEFVHMIT